jgi:hypothetical protein
VAAPSLFFEGAVGLAFRMSLLAIERSEHKNPDPFETERVGHPERLNLSLSLDVLSGGHLSAIHRQIESWERVSHWPEPCSLSVGEARWGELCLPLWQYFRAMADPSIQESQLSARPWTAARRFQFDREEIADLAK